MRYRSHLLVYVRISSRDRLSSSVKRSKLMLVDLAGSERQSRMHAEVCVCVYKTVGQSFCAQQIKTFFGRWLSLISLFFFFLSLYIYIFSLSLLLLYMFCVQNVRLTEACAINRSLSTLGNCVSALQKGSIHVPYRDDPLTTLLQVVCLQSMFDK